MSPFLSKTAKIIPTLTMLTVMEVLIQKPELFWTLSIVLISVVILASFYLSGFLKQKNCHQLIYIILPLFFTLGVIAIFALTQKSIIQHFFLGGVSIILGVVLHNIEVLNRYRFRSREEVILQSEAQKRKKRTLNINQTLLLLTSFFIIASLFAIIYLLSFPIWQALLIATIAIFCLVLQFLSEVSPVHLSRIYATVVVMVVIQLFWALTFWPTNYIANAVVITIVTYIILGILEHHSQETLTRGILKVYFTIAILALTTVLLTAQWGIR